MVMLAATSLGLEVEVKSIVSAKDFDDNIRMAKTTKWLNAILHYMKKVKSSISIVYGPVF